jgi:hypothetical protein
MWTTEDQTVAVGHSVAVDPTHWQELFDELLGRVAGRFARVEPRRRAKAFVRGLLADLPRKNCWTIAEHVGDPSPDGMQHLLGRAVWDEDALRDDVRAYLVEHLGRGELHDRGDQTEVIVVHCAFQDGSPQDPTGAGGRAGWTRLPRCWTLACAPRFESRRHGEAPPCRPPVIAS